MQESHVVHENVKKYQQFDRLRRNIYCCYVIIKDFAGNSDWYTVVNHDLNPPIRERYIHFRPLTWYSTYP